MLCAVSRGSALFPRQGRSNVGAVTCVVRATRPEETGEDVPAVIVDADFYAMVLLLRRGTCRELSPSSVELRRAPGSEKFLEKYYGCPVICGAKRNALILSRENAYYPFVDYSKELFPSCSRATSRKWKARASSLR